MPDVDYSETPEPVQPQDSEVDVMARTIYGEVRGEAYQGKIAVGWVIMNRVAFAQARDGYWWGSTIREVCLKPWQFSCWNANDPNRKVIESVGPNDPNFSQCFDVAGRVVSGKVPNPVEGATR